MSDLRLVPAIRVKRESDLFELDYYSPEELKGADSDKLYLEEAAEFGKI